MNYEKGKQYTFPVNEVMLKPLWGKLYFNILANGNPVRVLAMEFQRENNPTELKCICTSDDPANLKFEQDRAVLLPQIYKVGETYEFKVVSDKPINGAYRLQDGNGWPFRLVNRSREKLMRYSVVKCRVEAINGTDLELSLVHDRKTERVPVLSPQEVVALDTTGYSDSAVIFRLMNSNPAFADAINEYEQGNPLWVLLAVEAAHLNMSEWMTLNQRNAVPLLNSIRAICLSLLQTSGFLDTFAIGQKEEYRQQLIRTILHTEDYLEALDLVSKGGEQKYIDETLALIQNATFIFRPERRMHVLMSIFTIKVAYVSAYIHQIFKIIKERHGSAGFMSLFKEAFIDMIDLYILNAQKFVMSDSKASVKDMVEALAIQLLLTSNRMHPSSGIYRTKLYRYASMLVSGDEAVTLLDRAYDQMLSAADSDLGITWSDLDNVSLMAHALAVKTTRPGFDTVYAFEGHNASLTFDGRTIRVMPTVKSVSKWIPALPARLFSGYDVQIFLNERLSEKAGGVGKSIPKAHRLWDELEKALFAPVTVVRRVEEKAEVPPSVGQEVTIRVISKEMIDRDQRFNCVVEEDGFCGRGFFRRENIVRYPVRINAGHFMSEDGAPYLLKATVMDVDADGVIEFTLRPGLNSCARDLADEMRVTEEDCYATITGGDEPGSRGYLCVSTDGFPLNIAKNSAPDKLVKGDRVITRIHEVKYNRKAETLYVNATFKDYADEEPLDQSGLFDELSDAVQALISIYADGRVYNAAESGEMAEPESSQKPTEYMDPEDLREAIAVMSARGAEYADYFTSYNWLAATRIIALMAGDREEASLLSRRMDLIRAIDNFGSNGRPDHASLGPLLEQCRKLREKDADINIKLNILSILSSLDRPASDQIHIPSANLDGGRLNKMARLAVAYNSLRGMDYGDEQTRLRRGLYTLAGLEYDASASDKGYVTVADGEDQVTEFKSSLIFPAGNKMQPDEKKQMTEIMQIVCGFLNSRQGGTLYIGVDNFGQPIGLDSDFTQLNGRNRNYDLQLMRDQFDLRFRNGFYDYFGVTPGGHNLSADNVMTSFEDYDKNMVYIVRVLPAPEAVTMTDGSMFVRQGTSTRPIVGQDNQRKFRTMRARQRV